MTSIVNSSSQLLLSYTTPQLAATGQPLYCTDCRSGRQQLIVCMSHEIGTAVAIGVPSYRCTRRRLLEMDMTTIDGVPVTSLARTVLDLCRTVPIEQAVAAGDAPWRSGWYARSWRSTLPRWHGGRELGRRGALLPCLTLEARARVNP